MTSLRPKLGWINKKSFFNQIQESQEDDYTDQRKCLTGISPSERLGCMFATGLYSDCSFLIENVEIRAHKLILAAASPKMERLFLGSEVNESDLIEVPYTLRVMQLILKHIYLQDMDIESIDEAQDVIEAAYYFEMTDLVDLCCAGIEPETLDDFWPAINLACLYNSRQLKEACLSLALKNSDVLLQHNGFIQISPEALAFLLSREVINVSSEEEVINAVIIWAENHVEHTEGNHTSFRNELEKSGILQQLRVLSLPEEQFVNFINNIGKDIFSDEELDRLEYNYFSDTCENYISPKRIDRMLEQRIPISGTDYLAVNAENDVYEINVKVFQTNFGIRPYIKMLVLPSQINPANILYDNVSHRTHYNECILVEIIVNDKVTARGSFCERIKYSDDINITLYTFNYAPMYTQTKFEDDEYETKFYEAKIRIIFKNHGYYPLAVDSKYDQSAPLVLEQPCRFIHEFVLTSPRS